MPKEINKKHYKEEKFIINNKKNKGSMYNINSESEKGKFEINSSKIKSKKERYKPKYASYNNLDYNYISKTNSGLDKKNLYHYSNHSLENKENLINKIIAIPPPKKNDNKNSFINNSKIIKLNKNNENTISKLYKEANYKNNKFENKYQIGIKKKIIQILNKDKINNINTISYKNTKFKAYNPKNIYKKYSENDKEKENLIKEKDLFQLKKQIPPKFNSFKNSRNTNKSNSYYTSNSLKTNLCSRISKDYENKYPFHPVINDTYKTDLTFEERQNFFKDLYRKRKIELNKYYSHKNRDEYGNIFFRPKLISKSFHKGVEEYKVVEEDVFQKNYQIYKKYDLNKEKLVKKYEENKDKPVLITKNMNEKIMNKSKNYAFEKLFNDLDVDQDNNISGLNLNVTKIPDKIINIIQPILIELKHDNQFINKNEFLIAMDKLFKDISKTERREIINYYYKSRKNKSFCMNYNSRNKYNFNMPYNNYKSKDLTLNNDTNKLAYNYYNKIKRMYDELCLTSPMNNKKSKKKNKNNLGRNINRDNGLTNISNYTFNNYIKSLN